MVELEAIDDGLQGDGEGLGGVDDGINGNDDEHIQKDKDDIDDEKAIADQADNQSVEGDSDSDCVMTSIRAYKRKRDAITSDPERP